MCACIYLCWIQFHPWILQHAFPRTFSIVTTIPLCHLRKFSTPNIQSIFKFLQLSSEDLTAYFLNQDSFITFDYVSLSFMRYIWLCLFKSINSELQLFVSLHLGFVSLSVLQFTPLPPVFPANGVRSRYAIIVDKEDAVYFILHHTRRHLKSSC